MAIVAVAGALACDTREAMEPELRFELSRAYEDIDDARRALASGAVREPERPGHPASGSR